MLLLGFLFLGRAVPANEDTNKTVESEQNLLSGVEVLSVTNKVLLESRGKTTLLGHCWGMVAYPGGPRRFWNDTCFKVNTAGG